MKFTAIKLNSQHVQLKLENVTTAEDGSEKLALLKGHKGYVTKKVKKEFARSAGVSEEEMELMVFEVMDDLQPCRVPKVWDVPGEPLPEVIVPAQPRVFLRPLLTPQSERIEFPAESPQAALRDALACATFDRPDPRIEWEDADALACLDIDYAHPPYPAQLAAMVGRAAPQPFLWHPSHGGGAKLYYHAENGYTARELAALAGFSVVCDDPHATVEVKRDSRHPFYPRTGVKAAPAVSRLDMFGGEQLSSLQNVGKFFARELSDSETTAEARERYLEHHRRVAPGVEWAQGAHLPHEHCPIAPGVGKPASPPVWIGDDAIHCHYCKAQGYALPNEQPGVMHYTSWEGGTVKNNVRFVVRNLSHWTHAKYVLRHAIPGAGRLPNELLRLAYSAALKATHDPHDPRIPAVFSKGEGIVRLAGRFAAEAGSVTFGKDITATLKGLPAVQWLQSDGEGGRAVKVDAERVDKLKQPGWNTATLGYPALLPICGFRVWGVHNPYRDSHIRYDVPPTWLESRLPRYVKPHERTPEAVEAAWQLVETVFPGISRNYVYLLIVLKGFAEAAASQCQFAIVHGPSGSGKSLIPHFVAGVCGDDASNMVWQKDPNRFHQALKACADTGTFVVMDELFKTADAAKMPYRSAMDYFLNITSGTKTHTMYVGAVELGRDPVIIVTDVELPESVKNDLQHGRRFIEVELTSSVDWAETMAAAGISKPREFRTIDEAHARACDIILSEGVDLLRPPGPPPSLSAILKQLGYAWMMEDSIEAVEGAIRRFYEAVTLAPELSGNDAKRYGKFWKKIKLDGATELNEAWEDVADQGKRGSRVMKERDISKVLKMPPGIRFDAKAVDASVFVRFYRGAPQKPTWNNGKDVAAEISVGMG